MSCLSRGVHVVQGVRLCLPCRMCGWPCMSTLNAQCTCYKKPAHADPPSRNGSPESGLRQKSQRKPRGRRLVWVLLASRQVGEGTFSGMKCALYQYLWDHSCSLQQISPLLLCFLQGCCRRMRLLAATMSGARPSCASLAMSSSASGAGCVAAPERLAKREFFPQAGLGLQPSSS